MLRNPKQLKFIAPIHIPNGKSGKYEISHTEHPVGRPLTVVSPRTAIFTGQEPLRVCYNEPVPITVLKDKDGIWMTDSPEEQASAHSALTKCKGRVLVGGLGLGYFVKKLQEKNNVKSVVVIEISNDVIRLVWNHLKLDKRFSILRTDIKKFLKGYKSNRKFDWVYLDIWRGDGESEFVNTVLPLKRLACETVCSKVGHILSWQEDVMLSQIYASLVSRMMIDFDKITSMDVKEFDKVFRPNNKYAMAYRTFWLFIRKNQVNAEGAKVKLPAYMRWVGNGMNGDFQG